MLRRFVRYAQNIRGGTDQNLSLANTDSEIKYAMGTWLDDWRSRGPLSARLLQLRGRDCRRRQQQQRRRLAILPEHHQLNCSRIGVVFGAVAAAVTAAAR